MWWCGSSALTGSLESVMWVLTRSGLLGCVRMRRGGLWWKGDGGEVCVCVSVVVDGGEVGGC